MEAVEVTYDPQAISYEALLEVFWNGQPNDLPPPDDARVRTAVLVSSEAERLAAERWRAELARINRTRITTTVQRFTSFTPAEPLHQKFYLQRSRRALVDELATRFPTREAFLASTAAARLNAALIGLAGSEAIEDAARRLGVDAEALARRLEGAAEPSLAREPF